MKKRTNSLAKTAFLVVAFLSLCLPGQARGAPKTLVLFPLTVYADQSKAYVGQGVKSMLVSRLSGGDDHHRIHRGHRQGGALRDPQGA